MARYGITARLPAGNYWRKLPGPPPDGSVRLVSTTYNNSLGCEVRTGVLYSRRIKTVLDPHQSRAPELQDEEWEVL